MRVLAPLLLLLTAPVQTGPAPTNRGPARTAPTPRDVLAADAETRWIAFDLTPGNQMLFALMLDGKPIRAILDTGVSYSVLSRRYAEAEGLDVRAGGRASAIGGGVAIGWVDTASIVAGGLTRTAGRVGVAALPASATGSAIDMLVGRDLTAGYALDIDYDARRFRLIRSGRLPFRGLAAPLAISPQRQVYVSEARVAGQRIAPLIVDTGDGNAVTLSTEAIAAARIISPRHTSTISFGLGGPIVTGLTILPEARFGAVVANDIEVQIEPLGGFSHAIGMAGRIGSGFLQRYRVLLDPTAGRMVLAPGRKALIPPLRSTSGVLVAAEAGRLRVLHVMRGSPAETGGWAAGDLICAIDGAPVRADYAASPMAGWSIAAPGRVVTLTLCDGAVRTITLRSFY